MLELRYTTSMGTRTTFVVSDDTAVRDSIKELVESAGLHAETFSSLQAFLHAVAPGHGGCLVLDAHMDDLSDENFSANLEVACARMPGLLLTNRGDVSMAVRALKAGAMDVVQKSYRDKNLLDRIKKVLEVDEPGHR